MLVVAWGIFVYTNSIMIVNNFLIISGKKLYQKFGNVRNYS
jgi:hypothetical protein